jgi:hypothetical protein
LVCDFSTSPIICKNNYVYSEIDVVLGVASLARALALENSEIF